MKNVVVFMPPPVELGDAPINMSIIVVILLIGVSEAWSIVENPAVLLVVLWKNAFIIFSPKGILPSVFGLFHSAIRNRIKPNSSRILVIINTIFVCCFIFLFFQPSNNTTKPIPPTIISSVIGNINNTLFAKGVRLANSSLFEPNVSNPALQKDATDRNIALNKPNAKLFEIFTVLYSRHNAPIPSMTNVRIMTFFMNLTTPCILSLLMLSCIVCLFLKLIFLPNMSRIDDVIVTIPSPPICIRNSIIILPNSVKEVDISIVCNPVTHTPLVLVNSASIAFSQFPFVLDMGRDSKKAPIKIINIKPRIIFVLGEIFILFLIFSIADILYQNAIQLANKRRSNK